MECQFCKNVFVTKTSLNNHQKTAKYCLKLRNVKLEINYKCDGCGKTFSRSYHLQRHQKQCKSNERLYELESKLAQSEKYIEIYKQDNLQKDKIIEEQKETIKDLQLQMQEVALKAVSRPTNMTKNTQINNYIQQLKPVTDELLLDNVQHLSIDHIMKGPEGYAQYALEYPLKDRLICIDYARRKVKFKDKDGNVITDPEMTALATKFFNSIKNKNKSLILECSNKLKENFGDEVDTIVKIFDYKAAVDSGSDGVKTDFHHDFVKQMCSQTIKIS